MKRKIFLLIAVTLILGLVTGCMGQTEDPNELVINIGDTTPPPPPPASGEAPGADATAEPAADLTKAPVIDGLSTPTPTPKPLGDDPHYVDSLPGYLLRASDVGDKEIINGKNMVLTFVDEFDGNTLDTSKWEYCPNQLRNEENGWWDYSMVELDGNGRLLLNVSYDEAKKKYISGAIRTSGIFEQTYGYFEIRCKLQSTPGYWCAFWMINASGVGIPGGSDSAEIDILESAYLDGSRIVQAVQWDYDLNADSAFKETTLKGIYDGYHTYALSWDEDRYTFFVDGVQTWKTAAGGICEVPLYMKVTADIGSWAGDITAATLPDTYAIDYVRAYQFEDKYVPAE